MRAAMHQPMTDGIETWKLQPLELDGSCMQSC